MKKQLKAENSQKIRRGLFNIDIYLPGLSINNPADPNGLFQLGRFDMAHLLPGVFVGMHPHRDDEILTYIREGTMVHEDTEGGTEQVSETNLMLMNAGKGIYHQESIPNSGKDVKLLQIFIRPERPGLEPRVQFSTLGNAYSINKWRVVAGPIDHIPKPALIIQSAVLVYDCRLQGDSISIHFKKDKFYLLFVFDGQVENEGIKLKKGDGLIFSDESITLYSGSVSDLVLFELDQNAPYTREGMYSGVS
ncbi:pirin family protein [Aquiflexum lacus]|uniref:pirin family protein n=1 Tax=Aquiflexum lacus TaxID=2483805 RepID=UPI0018930209|nr:pirin family protein [Aquiflexum lacus]